MIFRLGFLALLMALVSYADTAFAQTREVAITIDDLPRGTDGGPYDLAHIRRMTEKLLRPFREERIPLIGFVNPGRNLDNPDALREILELWLDAGAELGNHSYSHPDINEVSLDAYLADIEKAEGPIRAALDARGKKLEFFRHPYLHTGPQAQIKQRMQKFLDSHGYRVAPVTLDDADYEFAALYTKPEFRERVRHEYIPYMEAVVTFFERRSAQVAGHEVRQILLIHASELNADMMPDLLNMFRRRGYTFVTLARALEDPAYQMPENYVGRNGFSWIHRWSQSKGMAARSEPDPAAWVEKAYAAVP